MSAEPAQKYWAFLSYSHVDSGAATKLHRALEHYTLPRQVRRVHGLPKRLIPVFRDTEELEAAAGLTSRLQDALDQSRWMIVLCSPASAGSRYVNEEIEYFLKRHGPSRILCVLLEGEPPACFPAAIRGLQEEPLAADLRTGADFDLAVLRLIAAMAVVGFTELRNREAQRKRRTRLAIAAGVAAAAIGGIATWDLLYREHVGHYASYVRRNGIWEGVDRLAEATVLRRANSYRFTRYGRLRPPQRVVFHKGCGTFEKLGMTDVVGNRADIDFASRAFCSASFRYHEGGTIAQETLHSRTGHPLETLTYTEPGLAQFTEQGFAAASSRSGIYYVQFERDGRGFDSKVLFLQSRGVPRANNLHAFGYAYDYDDAGRVVGRSVLDDKEAELGEVTRYVFGPGGAVVERQDFDGGGEPRVGIDGFAAARMTVDPYGNVLSRKVFAADGSPTTDLEGVFERRSRWDANGDEVETRYYDAAGQPAINQFGVSGQRLSFDANSFRTRIEFLGTDGLRAVDNEGEAILEFDNDAWGNNLENRVFDVQGKPSVWNNGVSITRKKFDERGNEIEQAFFGVDGKPVITTWGAMIRNKYDERGNIVEFAFFDGDGRPHVRIDTGAAMYRLKLDEKGNEVEVVNFGADGKPAAGRSGWVLSRAEYDDHGDLVRRDYLDAQGRPVMTAAGFASLVSRFDRLGWLAERHYLDTKGLPARRDNGSSGFSLKHDRHGWMSERTYLDSERRPLNVYGGFATVRYRNHDLGYVLEETYLDASGKPPAPPHAARTLFEYDDHNREILRRCVDISGAPANGPHDYGLLKTERDRYGRVLSERATDVRGKPVNIREQRWATHLVSYEGGKKEQYLDAAGKPVTPRMYRQ